MNIKLQKNGYARLIRDLARSDKDGSFQARLSTGGETARELASLLQLAKNQEREKVAQPAPDPSLSGR